MSPHTQGQPGTHHTVITVERETKKKRKKKAKEGMEGRQKTKKAIPLKKRQPLRENKRLHYALPSVVPNSRYSEPRDLREPEHVRLRLLRNSSILDPNAQENQHLFVVN